VNVVGLNVGTAMRKYVLWYCLRVWNVAAASSYAEMHIEASVYVHG